MCVLSCVLLAAGIKEARQTYLALVPVVGGIVMATLNEPSFHLLGFLACTSATAGRALKSVVQVGGAMQRQTSCCCCFRAVQLECVVRRTGVCVPG